MFAVIISILLLALVIFSIWNLIISRRLIKSKSSTNTPLDDSKYYELKYKQEFLVAAFSLIAGIAVFFRL
jgi:hypothetical protein